MIDRRGGRSPKAGKMVTVQVRAVHSASDIGVFAGGVRGNRLFAKSGFPRILSGAVFACLQNEPVCGKVSGYNHELCKNRRRKFQAIEYLIN